jgi:hypothetical protein
VNKRLIFYLLTAGTLLPCFLFAQREKHLNLQDFDNNALHFGFLIGANTSNFLVKPNTSILKDDSLYILQSHAQPGFNLGIVSNFRLGYYFDFRFLPSLAFATRNLDYTFYNPTTNKTIVRVKQVESTLLDFPFNIKYKSQRVNNFRMYVIGGFKYSVDLASQKDVNTGVAADKIVKLYNNDYAWEIGVGLDIYFDQFKFAPEFKYSNGMRNIIVKDGSIFSNAIDKLYSQMFLVSFLFE